jgi:uncharacterized protein YxjI
MKYAIKQKFFTLAESFTIKDEGGSDVFKVKAQLFSIPKKLRLFDMSENELCLIQKKMFKLLPEYEISMAGQLRANVKKRFALFRNDFTITAGGGTYEVKGDWVGFDFTIIKSDREVARISKKFFSWTDTYGVEIADGEDAVELLALAIVIDMVCHNNKKK